MTPSNTPTPPRLLLVTISLFVLTTSGCFNAPSAITPTPTLLPLPSPTADKPPGNVLRAAVIGASFDRDLHHSISEWPTLFGPGLAHSRLLRFAQGPQVDLPSMAVVCDLCVRWERVDPLTYEFTLHAHARWQRIGDWGGRPVTPEDIAFSLERLRDPASPHHSLLAAIARVEIIGEHSIRLHLRYPEPEMPQLLANPHAVVVLPELIQADSGGPMPVVGSGPWRWTGGLSGQSTLVANPSYFRSRSDTVREIHMLPMDSIATAEAALVSGRVDVAPVSEERWPELRTLGYQSVLVPRQGIGLVLGINAAAAPFDELRVRQALLLALHPKRTLDDVWPYPASVGVGIPVVNPDWLLSSAEVESWFANNEEARRILASIPESERTITLSVGNFGPEYLDYAQATRTQLEEAGLAVHLEVQSRSTYVSQIWHNGSYQVFLGPLPPVFTTNTFLLSILHSSGQWHITNHGDRGLDDLIEAQSAEHDLDRRAELVRAIQRRVLELAILFMPAIAEERWAFNDRVRHFYPNMVGGDGSFWQVVRLDSS